MADPFRQAYCGKCGYDLGAHNDEGTCPECGQRFNKRLGTGTKAERLPAGSDRPHRMFTIVVCAAIALSALTCGGLMSLAVDNLKPLGTAMVVVLITAMALWASLKRSE